MSPSTSSTIGSSPIRAWLASSTRSMRRQHAHQKAFLAMALGGPRAYRGRGLAEAHTHLGISDHHVDLVAGHLAAVLAGLGVSPALIDEVVSAVDGLRDTVLGRG
jgi:hemoglobin